jgi:hypothetical protein
VVGPGTPAAVSTAIVGPGRPVIDPHTGTVVIASRNILMPTVAGRRRTPGTHRGFLLVGMASVILYRAFNPRAGQRPCSIHRAVLAAAALLAISVAEEVEAWAAAANGGMTVETVDVNAKITETDPSSEMSEAESESDYTTATASGTGSEINVIESTFLELAGQHPRRYGHDPHRRSEISGMREMYYRWESMQSEPEGDLGMDRFLRVPPTQTPCLRRLPTAADLVAVEVEASDAAGGIGTREAAGIGGPFTTTGIVTHEVGRRRADGDGNRMNGIVEIPGTRIPPGTCETSARLGIGKTGSGSLFARSRTGYRTSLRLQRMSRPRLSPPPRPRLARSRAASRHRRKFSRSPGSPHRPVRGR